MTKLDDIKARLANATETWKPVKNYEKLYEVSDQGNVRSLWFRNGSFSMARKSPKLLKLRRTKWGYFYITLTDNKRQRRVLISRLVLETFVGQPPHGYYAAHLDGDTNRNTLVNLAWCSPKENQFHRKAHGTWLDGENSPASKLKEPQVQEILLKLKSGEKGRALAKQYNISTSTISRIKCGKNWNKVSNQELEEILGGEDYSGEMQITRIKPIDPMDLLKQQAIEPEKGET